MLFRSDQNLFIFNKYKHTTQLFFPHVYSQKSINVQPSHQNTEVDIQPQEKDQTSTVISVHGTGNPANGRLQMVMTLHFSGEKSCSISGPVDEETRNPSTLAAMSMSMVTVLSPLPIT